MVALPQESSNKHAALQNWKRFTGKDNLAHEIKGYDKWKLITDAEQQEDVLSLLSEFAQLDDPSYLKQSWEDLTFTTYLQPSEKISDFRIIAGERSVPSFASLSCATLDISSSASPERCFSDTGSDPFVPLPVKNQPVVEVQEEAVQTQDPALPQSPAIEETPQPTLLTFQQKPIVSSVTPGNLAGHHLPPSATTGPKNYPPDPVFKKAGHLIEEPKGSTVLRIILFSLLGVSTLAAVVFAAIYFWPSKILLPDSSEIAKSDEGNGGTGDESNINTKRSGDQTPVDNNTSVNTSKLESGTELTPSTPKLDPKVEKFLSKLNPLLAKDFNDRTTIKDLQNWVNELEDCIKEGKDWKPPQVS